MTSNYLLATTTMTAFALNSLFARYALGYQAIDPMSFTLLRLLSGAVTLVLLYAVFFKQGSAHKKETLTRKHSASLGASLFSYALLFSLAYHQLDTGTGALILFGTVQLALIAYHRLSGHAINRLEWVGISVSLVGFVVLLQPSSHQPDIGAAILMGLSGLSWAIFTLLGKHASVPIVATKQGFMYGATMMVLVYLIVAMVSIDSFYLSKTGVGFALLSGVGASAIGYYLWYQLLPKIDLLQASLLQLTVPVIALALGIIFIDEQFSLYSCIATLFILSGIALVSFSKWRNQ
ncbi:hypothetical protein BCU70_01225 [Vibrio sp. 10N.286.49.C2]|uniref:DMT family transporter n=1 Tax=unclassified Vibrio TaxID=2614977 RepID=UPI000CC859BC|nr:MULTISPECIES: EamA family transporter [unclassified Vibrio]PMH42812.1 hypothetical protein BCU70_01225 [Vibrio sp. 10N.286.49.C2]PMH53849.1 hypothetical protein BCU66_13610 [Vibrio sp. 10N.286.49.B1]PMH81612.1 hypothetical protein BCU58_20940 [Vibrio sp. 10N.286.48.B7]